MNFEWDDKKNEANLKKHKISFNEAVLVFYDPFAQIEESTKAEEQRLTIIGSIEKGVVFVVYIEKKGSSVRIISARKAKKKERKFYEAQWENI